MERKLGTIKAPPKPKNIPEKSQWLSGQGVGTWFCIDATKNEKEFLIKRYTPNGDLDCERIFEIENKGIIFDIHQVFKFTHISHCAKCVIVQNNVQFIFNYKP